MGRAGWPASSRAGRDSLLERQLRRCERQRRDLRLRHDGCFEVLHTFSATNPTTGANWDGATPDDGLVLDGNKLIGIAIYGGIGSPAGLANSGGTLYELTLDD